MDVRLATADDVSTMRAVYGQYIDTTVSFEYDLPSPQQFAARVRDIAAQYPYLLCEDNGKLLGYAYAHRHLERAAYQWNAELSIYLDKAATGRGVGKKLYLTLIELLRLQGVKTVYGVVTVPNPASESLHASLDFRLIGVYRNAGYKDGAWRDVAWFEKAIAPYDDDPSPLIPIGDLPPQEVERVLKSFC